MMVSTFPYKNKLRFLKRTPQKQPLRECAEGYTIAKGAKTLNVSESQVKLILKKVPA
jgi:hypothetical protein